jgi:hypothetical protein
MVLRLWELCTTNVQFLKILLSKKIFKYLKPKANSGFLLLLVAAMPHFVLCGQFKSCVNFYKAKGVCFLYYRPLFELCTARFWVFFKT